MASGVIARAYGHPGGPALGPADIVLAMSGEFSVRIKVRGYELDTQGHLNWAEYLHYAEHARWECLAAAGITQNDLIATGFGPVVLDLQVRFKHELRGGDEVDVTCAFNFNSSRTYDIKQELRRSDGKVCASLTSMCGLLDLRERKLISAPGKHFLSLASDPVLLGLAG
jgi:acyl-CoA thioester hydrolase